MLAVEEMVKEGYQSLAKRALHGFERADELNEELDRLAFVPWLQFVGDLKLSGSPDGLLEIGNFIRPMVGRAANAIPSNLVPHDAETTFNAAGNSVFAYYDIADLPAFLERTGINEIHIGSKTSGILTQMNSTSQRVSFLSHFTRQSAAISVVMNVHEMDHALLPERVQVHEILQATSAIDGMHTYIQSLLDDPAANKAFLEVTINTHQLNYLDSEERINEAAVHGVDANQLRTFLQENRATLDFLHAYEVGTAYINQAFILAESPVFEPYPAQRTLYELLALMDATVAPHMKPKGTFYAVGVGLAEYGRMHQVEFDALKTDKEFHHELSEHYFPRRS